MKYISGLCLLACSLFFEQHTFAQSSSEKSIIAQLVQGINTRDHRKIITLLDDSCKIANLPRGINDRIIPAIFNEKFSTIDTYQVTDTKKEDANTRVLLAVTYKGGSNGHPDLLFDNKDKIIELNIIKGVTVSKPDTLLTRSFKGNFPDTLSIAFKLRDHLIYIPAEVDGQRGEYFLDSGSAFVILEGRYFKNNLQPEQKMEDRANLIGINGVVDHSGKYQVATLKIGKLLLQDFQVFTVTTPADQNEEPGEEKVLGTLGYEVFKDYEVTFDYQHQRIFLRKTDQQGNLLTPLKKLVKPLYTAKITMQRHIPILKMSVGAKEYAMGIDCGANTNLFFSPFYEELKPYFTAEETVDMQGMGGSSSSIKTYLLNVARVGPLVYDQMLTAISDQHMKMSYSSQELKIDGIIGYPFLSRYITAVNFKKGEVSFYKNDN